MDTSGTKSAVQAPPKRSWRRHSEEFKARVIALALQPNTSVAAVAMANGLNANMLRRWVREAEVTDRSEAQVAQLRGAAKATFVQLPVATLAAVSSEPTAPRVEVEILRNGTTLRASLPLDSRSAAWLREVTG